MRHPRPASAAPLPAASESAARLLRVKPRRTCRGPARVMDLPGCGRGSPLCDISVSLTRGGRHDLVGGASERTFSNPFSRQVKRRPSRWLMTVGDRLVFLLGGDMSRQVWINMLGFSDARRNDTIIHINNICSQRKQPTSPS